MNSHLGCHENELLNGHKLNIICRVNPVRIKEMYMNLFSKHP